MSVLLLLALPGLLDGQGIISTFAGNGNVVRGENVPATSVAIGFPTGVAIDRAGNLYIAEGNGIGIRKVTPAGIISTFAGSPTGVFTGTGNGDGGGPRWALGWVRGDWRSTRPGTCTSPR